MNRLACTCYFIVIVLTNEFYLGNAFSQGHLPKHKCGFKILLRTAETDINEEPVTTIERTVEEEDDDERDELVDSVTNKLEEMSGLWYSDDFYGPHGREWVKVSATVVGEMATSALEATKVTGDPHVPAGCVTFRTSQWPGVGEKVPAQIQVRSCIIAPIVDFLYSFVQFWTR